MFEDGPSVHNRAANANADLIGRELSLSAPAAYDAQNSNASLFAPAADGDANSFVAKLNSLAPPADDARNNKASSFVSSSAPNGDAPKPDLVCNESNVALDIDAQYNRTTDSEAAERDRHNELYRPQQSPSFGRGSPQRNSFGMYSMESADEHADN